MERIEELGLLVDWERGRIYRDGGVLDRLLETFGGSGRRDLSEDPQIRRKVVEHRIRRLYRRAVDLGRTDLTPSEGVKVSFLPDRVVVDSARFRGEVTPGELILLDREQGLRERKEVSLRELHGIFRELERLLEGKPPLAPEGLGREALWMGAGLLGGLLISELLHHGHEGEISDYEPPDPSVSFDDFDLI